MAQYKKSLTLTEALDLLMETDSENEIFIEPPDVCDLTDEDSGDENLDGSYNIYQLSYGQLLAPAELRLRNKEIDCDSPEDCSQHISSSSPKRRKKATSKESKTAEEYIWTREASLVTSRIFPEGNYAPYSDLSPAELFELFIDENILELIKNEMTKYAIKRNWPDVNVQTSELKVFISILLVSGYNPLPRRPMYWSKSEDLFNEAVSNAMRRDRFDSIMKYLHFNAVNLDTSDKYTKLRPLIQHLQNKFMLHFVPTKNVSHDKTMVEYFGKHGCKQAIRNRPIRFGYKVWCQNTSQGYLCAFDIYQGKTFRGNEEIEKVFGKCSSTVLHLVENYSDEKKVLPYHFFFGNLFTSLPLLHELRKRGYDGTGTLRNNRLEKLCPLKSSVDISKSERGCFDAVTGTLDHTKINVTRWMDNAVVTVASTLLRENPVGKVKRWSRKDSKHIQVNIPHVIDIYNKFTGGTDRMNQNIKAYRISIRGKKWWWPLFTWLIDASVQNAWILARCTGKSHDLLEFRREIAMSYLLRFQDAEKTPDRTPSIPGENEARFDQRGHFVEPTPNNARRRCAGGACDSRVRMQCCKCGVGLCVHCFLTYHTR